MRLGRSHWHPHATGTDLTQRWAGKPWGSLPALPGGQKREFWQGHTARYFPGACIPRRIVLPAGITSIPLSHSSIFSDRCSLKIEQKRPQSSFGFVLGSRVWPQTCCREPPCARLSQAGGTPHGQLDREGNSGVEGGWKPPARALMAGAGWAGVGLLRGNKVGGHA